MDEQNSDSESNHDTAVAAPDQRAQEDFNRNIHVLLELHSQNKLSTLNPWDSAYIGQLDRFILGKKGSRSSDESSYLDVDFGEKAAIIDASSTIYAYKVQSLYDSMSRVVEALAQDVQKKKKTSSSNDPNDPDAPTGEKSRPKPPPPRTIEPEEQHTQAPESTNPYDIIFAEATTALKNNTGVRTLLCYSSKVLPNSVNMICDQDSDPYALLGLDISKMDAVKRLLEVVERLYGDPNCPSIVAKTSGIGEFVPNRLADNTPDDIREYYNEQVTILQNLARNHGKKVLSLRQRLDVMLDSRYTIDAMIDITNDLPLHVQEQKKIVLEQLKEYRFQQYIGKELPDEKMLQTMIIPTDALTIPSVNMILDDNLEWFLHDVETKERLYKTALLQTKPIIHQDDNNNNNDDDDQYNNNNNEPDATNVPLPIGFQSNDTTELTSTGRRAKKIDPAILQQNAEQVLHFILQQDRQTNNNNNTHFDNNIDSDQEDGLTLQQRRKMKQKQKNAAAATTVLPAAPLPGSNQLCFYVTDQPQHIVANMKHLEASNIHNNVGRSGSSNGAAPPNPIRNAILSKLTHANPQIAKELGIFQQNHLPITSYLAPLYAEDISTALPVIPDVTVAPKQHKPSPSRRRSSAMASSVAEIMYPPAPDYVSMVQQQGLASSELTRRCQLGYILPPAALPTNEQPTITSLMSPTKRYRTAATLDQHKAQNMFDFAELSNGKLVSLYAHAMDEPETTYFLSMRDRRETERQSLRAGGENAIAGFNSSQDSSNSLVQLDGDNLNDTTFNANILFSAAPPTQAAIDVTFDDFGNDNDNDAFYNEGDFNSMFGSQIIPQQEMMLREAQEKMNFYGIMPQHFAAEKASLIDENNNHNDDDDDGDDDMDTNAELYELTHSTSFGTSVVVDLKDAASQVASAYNLALSMMTMPTSWEAFAIPSTAQNDHKSRNQNDDHDNDDDESSSGLDDSDQDDDDDDQENHRSGRRTRHIPSTEGSTDTKTTTTTAQRSNAPTQRPKTLLEAALALKKQSNHRTFQTLLDRQESQQNTARSRKIDLGRDQDLLFSDDEDNISLQKPKKRTVKAKVTTIDFDALINAPVPPATAGVVWGLSQSVTPQSKLLKAAMKGANIKSVAEGLTKAKDILPSQIHLDVTDILSTRTYIETCRMLENSSKVTKKDVTFIEAMSNYHNVNETNEQARLRSLFTTVQRNKRNNGTTVIGNIHNASSGNRLNSTTSALKNNTPTVIASASLSTWHQSLGHQLLSYRTRANACLPPRLPILSYESNIQFAENAANANAATTNNNNHSNVVPIVNMLLSRVVWNVSLHDLQKKRLLRALRLRKQKKKIAQQQHFASTLQQLAHRDISNDSTTNDSSMSSNNAANALLNSDGYLAPFNNDSFDAYDNDGGNDDYGDIGDNNNDDDDDDDHQIDDFTQDDNALQDPNIDFKAMEQVLEEQNRLMLAKQQESTDFLANLRQAANGALDIDENSSQQQQQQQQNNNPFAQFNKSLADPFGLSMNLPSDANDTFASDNPFHMGLYEQTKENALSHSTVSKYFNIRQLKRSLLIKLVKAKLPTIVMTNLQTYAKQKGIELHLTSKISSNITSTRHNNNDGIRSIPLPEQPIEAACIQQIVTTEAPQLLIPAFAQDTGDSPEAQRAARLPSIVVSDSTSTTAAATAATATAPLPPARRQIQALSGGITGECFHTTFKHIVGDIQYEYNDFDVRSVSSFFLSLLILSNETNLELRPRVLPNVIDSEGHSHIIQSTCTQDGEPFSLGYDLCNFDIYAPVNAGKRISSTIDNRYEVYGDANSQLATNVRSEYVPSAAVELPSLPTGQKGKANVSRKKPQSNINRKNSKDIDSDEQPARPTRRGVRKPATTKKTIKSTARKQSRRNDDDDDDDDDFIASDSETEQFDSSSSSSESESSSTEADDQDDDDNDDTDTFSKTKTPQKVHRRKSIPVRRESNLVTPQTSQTLVSQASNVIESDED